MTDFAAQADELDSIRSALPKPSLETQADELDKLRPGNVSRETPPSALLGDLNTFLTGAGKATADLGRGAKQILDVPAKWLESRFPGLSQWSQAAGFPSAAASAGATEKDVADSRVRDAELMRSGPGVAGNIAGSIAGVMLPLAGMAKGAALLPGGVRGATLADAMLNPSTYKAAAAAGGTQGALQPTTKDESRAENTLLGTVAGAAGNLGANLIGRVAQPVAAALSGAHQRAIQTLEAAGIPLDAAQKTGSAFLGKLRSSFSDNPFTAGAQGDLAAAQRVGYNRAVLKTIGEDATAATPEVMNAAEKRINGVFKDVLDRNNVALTDPIVARIGRIQAAASEEEKKPVAAIANRIINGVGDDGKISGQIAYGIKKDLDRLASSADTTLAYHARQLRSTVMDAINESLQDADKQAFSVARQQFSNMKRIEPTIDKAGNGNVSPQRLAGVMAQKANRQASVYGKGDQELVDLAHAGNMLLPDKNPNSGTVSRAIMQAGLPLIAGGAEGIRSQDMGKSLAAAGAAYALPKAIQSVINNPSTANYLARGMQGNMTPLRDLMLLPQTNAAVGGALRRLPQELLNKNQ